MHVETLYRVRNGKSLFNGHITLQLIAAHSKPLSQIYLTYHPEKRTFLSYIYHSDKRILSPQEEEYR